MPDPGPYTTITVKEYNHMAEVILDLRRCKQQARIHLERGEIDKALELLREDKN